MRVSGLEPTPGHEIETMVRPPSSSSVPVAMGSDRRSCRIPMPSAVATSGSASERVPAVAAVRPRRPATYSQYARATVAGPSHAVSSSERGAASSGSSDSVHGASTPPPSSKVTGTAARMFTLPWMRRLADTV
jgi:hypothetical protein